MKRICIVGGAAGLLVAIVAICSQHSEGKQDPRYESGMGQPPSPAPLATVSQTPSGNDPVKEHNTIDDLLRKLDAIKAKKGELDKAEGETIALLREKLKQQEQRLQKLGVIGGGGSCTPPSSLVQPEVPNTPPPGLVTSGL